MSKEFKATKENIEELLTKGAEYKMSETPQYGINLIQWKNIDEELKKNINLNNCKFINTMDSFILDGTIYNPIK